MGTIIAMLAVMQAQLAQSMMMASHHAITYTKNQENTNQHNQPIHAGHSGGSNNARGVC